MEPLSRLDPGTLPDPMLPRLFEVARRRRETHDTWTLELEPAEEGEAPAFLPGQFNMLYAFGVGEVPISISGDPDGDGGWVHTIRAVGAVTRKLCRLKKGEILGLRGPFGRPWPTTEAVGSDVVVIAGGIGLAPLRPLVYHLLSQRKKYGRVTILYGARSPRELLYPAELERWRGRFDFEVGVTVDHATSDWQGRVGVVTTLVPGTALDPDNTVAMLCGPEIMMRFAVRALRERGIPDEQIHVSMERNMKCGIGFCGHCQFGPTFVCKDGPVFPLHRIARFFELREV